MAKKLSLLLLFAAIFCGIGANAAPGGTWTTIEHLAAYPIPQNLMAELDGSWVTLSWDGVQWPADGFPEEIDGKTVPTDFYYSIECRYKNTGTDTWSDWWVRTSRGRTDSNGDFVSRWSIKDDVESGKTYQFRIRCFSYIEPENPWELTNPTRDGYFSEYSEIVTAYRTLDKLDISLVGDTPIVSLNGTAAIDVAYKYTSTREAEGEEPLYFTFKAIEIPKLPDGVTPEAPVAGGKPYVQRNGTPLTVKSLDVDNSADYVDPTNFVMKASSTGATGKLTWHAWKDIKNYHHNDVTLWVQGWAQPETEGGSPRCVLDEAIGKINLDTRTVTATPQPDQDNILLTWPKIPNAVRYEVWHASAKESDPYERIESFSAQSETVMFTDMSVFQGTRYKYKIVALDADGKEIDSNAGNPVYTYSRLDVFSTADQSLYSVEPQTPWNGKVDIVVRYYSARDAQEDGTPVFKLIAENYESGEPLTVRTLTRADGEVLDPNGFTLVDEQNLEQRLVWDAGADLGETLVERLRLTVECVRVEPYGGEGEYTAWTGSPAKYKENVRLDTRSPRIRKLGQGTHAYVNLDWFPGATKADLYCNGTLIHTTTDEYTRYKRLDNEELNIWGVNELKLVPDKGEPWVGYIAYPAFDFTVTKGIADGIMLTWNTVDDEAVGGYKILRRKKGSTADFDALATVAVDVTTYTDQTAEEATIYEYTVVPQRTWDANIGPVPAAKEGYRSLEKIEFVQVRQLYPWTTQVAIDVYYKSARQSSTDGELTYRIEAKLADGTEVPIERDNLHLETIDGMPLLPNNIPFGSPSLASGATTRIWWNAPTDLGTVQLPSDVISGIVLQIVPTLNEGAPAGAAPAPATVASAGFTVDLRTVRIVTPGEQIPVTWEWQRTDTRDEAQDYTVIYTRPEGSDTDEDKVLKPETNNGEGTIEVPDNEYLWPSFRLVKREMNDDDTDEAQQITLTSEVLFKMPAVAPQNVQATRGNADAVTVTWDPVPYADRYVVEITTVNERGSMMQNIKNIYDGTQYIHQNAPELGIVGYKVQACFPNMVTGEQSEQVVGWRSIDKAELKDVSTRWPWNGTVDIDLAYKTVRNQFAQLTGTNLPDRKVSVAVKTADGEVFLVKELIKERLEASAGMIWRERVDGRSPFVLGNADRITWESIRDAPRMHEPNSVITITFEGDEYSEPIVFERTFDLDTRTGVIHLPVGAEDIQIPWSTRLAKPEATSLGLGENDAWWKLTAVLADVTDNEKPKEILRTAAKLGEGTVTSWTPKKWGDNTVTLKLSPHSGVNETTEYAAVFYIKPDFAFTATQGNRDSIILEWNAPKGIHTYSIRRRVANTSNDFEEIARAQDTTRWADTSAETVVGEFEYTIMPLNIDKNDIYSQFNPVVGYRALDIARSVTIEPAANGTVTTDKATAHYGETVTLTIMPNEGYAIDQVRVMDGETAVDVAVSGSTYTFGMPTGNVVVSATLKAIDYSVTITPTANGTVIADKQSAHIGDMVTLTVTPAIGHAFVQLSVTSGGTAIDVAASGNTHTFQMPAGNVIVSATFAAIAYTTAIAPVQNGSVLADKETAHYNDAVVLTVTPDAGYALDQLTVMSGETKVDATKTAEGYTFTMPAGNVNVTATFVAIDYTVTTAPAQNGSVTADKQIAHIGDMVTLTVAPATGYALDQLTVMCGKTKVDATKTAEGYTFTMPAGNVQVTATFVAIDYTVTTASALNGNVTADKQIAHIGDMVTLTVAPATGYALDQLTVMCGENKVDTTKTAEGYTFTMPAGDVKVTATFKAIDYTVTTAPARNGSVTADKEIAHIRDMVVLTVAPATGYELDQLTMMNGETKVDTTKTAEGYTFTMPAGNVKVTATFKAIDYTVTTAPAQNGSVTADKQTAHYTDMVTLTITPATGYELDQLTVKTGDTEVSVRANNTFQMPADDVVVSATFKAIDYSITTAPAQNGTLTANKQTAHYTDEVVLTITPNTGYALDEVIVKAGETAITATKTAEGTYMFTMPAGNVVVSATFKAINYSITTAPAQNGTLTTNKQTAHYEDEVVLTATPAIGYELDELTVKSGDTEVKTTKTAEGTYIFTMPDNDVQVSVTFKAIDYTITTAPTQNGTLTANKQNAYYEDEVVLTITPATGYELNELTVKDGEIKVATTKTAEGTYTFTMPAADVQVSVTFKAINYSITTASAQNGSVTADKQTAHYTDVVTLTITPATGYELDQLTVKNSETPVPVSENYTFQMPTGDVQVSATFKAIDYSITTALAQNGSVTADKQTAHYTDVVTLTITSATGYELDKLTVKNGETEVPVSENYTFQMPAGDVQVSATFKAINYSITTALAQNGSVTADKQTAHYNDEVVLTITPATGYKLDEVFVKAGETVINTTTTAESTYTFSMPAGDVVISATFKIGEYSVDIVPTATGVVTPDKTTAHYGETITLTATPAIGYEFDQLRVMDGETAVDVVKTVEGNYTFTMPANDVIVSVTFKAIDYSITLSLAGSGSVIANKSIAHIGDMVVVTATPATGYELDQLRVINGETEIDAEQTSENNYTFTMPAGDVVVRATFTRISTDLEAPSAIDTADSNAPRKVLHNGIVYIIRDGKTYTLAGDEVEIAF